MTSGAVNAELHEPLLELHQQCLTVLASSRDIEAAGNLAVSTIRLIAGKAVPQDNTPGARLRADRTNLEQMSYIRTAAEAAHVMIFGEDELLWRDFTFRHIKPPTGVEGYVQSIDLQAEGTSPASFVQSERVVEGEREGLSIVVQESQLVAASLTRVSEQAETFARRCEDVFGVELPFISETILELLTGQFEDQEDLEGTLSDLRSIVTSVGFSDEEKAEALELLNDVPEHVVRSGYVFSIDRATIDGFTDFINSLAAK